MEEEILMNIQERIGEIPELKTVDEDWGQLDMYSPNFPVQWPCCLIDVNDGSFSDIGKDFSKIPKSRQNGKFSVKLTLADMKLTPTSLRTSKAQKETAWAVFGLMKKIHEKVHDFSPAVNCSKLKRTAFGRVKRDDGVQEYAIYYAFESQNV
ncbi:MAG: hypothetical protein E2590_12755 [Chryseobacterium sp.]|nr:hypothetical protein [Chryseobacterium sp.]